MVTLNQNNTNNGGSCLNDGNYTANQTLKNSNNGGSCLNDGNYTANQTLNNSSREANSNEIFTSISYWINILILCELPVTTYFISVALNIMLRCRKLSFSIRYLSVMVLIAFLSYAIINIIFSVVRLILGPNHYYYALIFDSRTFIASVLLSVLWCSMCVLTVERFVAIVCPYRYVQYVTKGTMYITVSFTWAINILIPIVLVFTSWFEVCGYYDYISKCNIFEVYRPFRIFTSFILCISFITTIAVYTKILLKVRQHEKEIRALNVKSMITATENDAQNVSESTPRQSIPTILIIILSFLVLQSPYLITFITFELQPDLKLHKWRVLLQITCYLCHELDTFVTLYLYIWRFSECKMHFYLMFSKINGKYREKAETLRIQVFNIVTFERNNPNISLDSCL